MSAGKSFISSHLQAIVYYGVAACTAAGAGGYLWRQSTRLDKEPPPIVAPAAPVADTKAAPEPEPEIDPFWAKVNAASQSAPVKSAPRSSSAGGEELVVLPPFNARDDKKGGPVKGHIAVSGRAGKFTAVAPATAADYQSGPYVPEPTYPVASSAQAPSGQQFYTSEEPAHLRRKREEETRRSEEERQRKKQEEQWDSKWQKRSIYK